MKYVSKILIGVAFGVLVLLALMVLALVFVFVQSWINDALLKNELNAWESETETIPSYVTHYHFIHENGEEKIEFKLGDILFVEKDVVWYVKDRYVKEEDKYLWCLASALKDGTNEIVHYEGFFADQFDGFGTMPSNGAYQDGRLALSDGENTVIYDISSGSYIEYEKGDIPFVSLHPQIQKDGTQVLFTKDGESKVFSVEEAAKDSAAWQYVWERGNKKCWDGEPQLVGIKNVQTVDDKTYIICSLHNFAGSGYAMAFEYDFESNSAKYCTWAFIGGQAYEKYYLIPTR